MANQIRLLHRLSGGAGAGSPTAVAPSGTVAINFDTGAGTPQLWASNGSAWQQLNPAGSVPYATGTEVITGTDAAKAVSPASLAAAGVVVSSGTATDAGKYVRTDAGGLVDDTVVPKAPGTDIVTGTVNDSFITPAGLAAAATDASVGSADAGKLVKLDANGKLDPNLLALDVMQYKGTVVPAAAAPGTPSIGDVYVISADGTMGAGWPGATGTAMQAGDQLIYNGTGWDVVGGAQINPDAYLPLAGTAGVPGMAMTSAAVITFNPTNAGDTVIDADNGAIINAVIDCGVF